MWQRRILWFSLALVMFFLFTLALGTVTGIKKTEAALLVHDIDNTAQNAQTAINTATSAINSATSVANELRMLASMSPEALITHYVGLSQNLAEVLGTYKAYQGIINSTKDLSTTWKSTFNGMDSIFNGDSKNLKNSQDTMKVLENTYTDSMKISNEISNVTQSIDNLKKAVNNSANADGTKEALQANGQITAVGVSEQIKQNQLLSSMVTSMAAKQQFELEEVAKSQAERTKSATDFSSAVEERVNSLEESKKETSYDYAVKHYGEEMAKYYVDLQ